jgi:nitrate reductase NapE component
MVQSRSNNRQENQRTNEEFHFTTIPLELFLFITVGWVDNFGVAVFDWVQPGA